MRKKKKQTKTKGRGREGLSQVVVKPPTQMSCLNPKE